MKCGCGGEWLHIGGNNAGCESKWGCFCSVPIHVCNKCGDFDYGENEEAEAIRFQCKKERAIIALQGEE